MSAPGTVTSIRPHPKRPSHYTVTIEGQEELVLHEDVIVAVGLTTDQSVEEAIRFALSVGNSGAFDELRSEIDTAPQRGVPVWEALDEFGRRVEVRELCEFAASIERQGLQGVSISETVSTLAASMRAKALDQLEREADKANANLSGPTIGFVVTTIVFLAFPLAQRINEAFGG